MLLLLKCQCSHIDETLTVVSANVFRKLLAVVIFIKFVSGQTDGRMELGFNRVVWCIGEGLSQRSGWTWALLMRHLLTMLCHEQVRWPAFHAHFLIVAWDGIDDLRDLFCFWHSVMLSSVPFYVACGKIWCTNKTRLLLSWDLWLFGISAGLKTPFNFTEPLLHPSIANLCTLCFNRQEISVHISKSLLKD